MKHNKNISLHGGHPWPKQCKRTAGKLSLNYEEVNIRNISVGNTEILRMIYFAVRDKEWLTVKPEIKGELMLLNEDSVFISFEAHFRSDEINFLAHISISAKSDNSLIFTFEGEALSTFRKNRIGLCVLHAVEDCAGKSCIIEHTDGSTEHSSFPEEISPHQIFRNIKSMRWMTGGLNCRLDFEGDIFETEDQRNWTDASFKTYSTPLSEPFPVTIEKGTKISQKVTLYAEGSIRPLKDTFDLISVSLIPDDIVRLPDIGICQTGRHFTLDTAEKKILRGLHFDHYRVDLRLFSPDWEKKAEQGFDESSELGWPIEFALFVDNDPGEQLKDFIKCCAGKKPSVKSVMTFHKDQPVIPDIIALETIPLIKEALPGCMIGTGTNANFAELNRNRPGDTDNDFICFSIHPQEHATDNYTLTENLIAQYHTVKSASLFAGKKKIFISPVTLARRFNANISYIELPAYGEKMPQQIDSRQLSLYGACWTLGSLKYLCESEADSVTFYQTTGERGIIQGEYDSLWPEKFPATRGMIFPIYHIFRYLLSNKDLEVVKSVSSDPYKTECLALTDGKKIRALLVNLTGEVQIARINCCSGLFRIRSLHSGNFSEAVSNYRWTGNSAEKVIKSDDSFSLEPCSVNFIEGWLRH